MNITIRVDSSSSLGLGHLVRCRTLAQALRNQGASVQFVCRRLAGDVIDEVLVDGFTVSILPPPTAEESKLDSQSRDNPRWFGATQEQDAAEAIASLGAYPSWLVVDHYTLGIAWERRLRPHVNRIFVIDDLANREHDCDVLLDQNLVKHSEDRYYGWIPEKARRLLGPRYALLRPEYAHYRRTLTSRDGRVKRVLLFFGGTDSPNLTGRALNALTSEGLRHLMVDAVVGVNNPYKAELIEQAKERGGTQVYDQRPHLADLMAAADLAVGAGGTTTWERCCLGLPSVVVSAADNQRPACEALAEDGLIVYAGDWNVVTVDDLRAAIEKLIHDPDRLRKMSAAAYCAVDGSGTERVVRYLLDAN